MSLKWHYTEPIPKRAQQKAVEAAISRLSRLNHQFIEITGVIGRPETERRCNMEVLVGGGDKFKPLIENLGNLFNWTINAQNVDMVTDSFQAAYEESKGLIEIQDKRITIEEADKREADLQARATAARIHAEQSTVRALKNQTIIESLTPPNACAAILAQLDEDDSDLMTDYHNHRTTRRVLIGFRTGKREDFRQLRAAAARFEPTKHLGPGCDRFEVTVVFSNTLNDPDRVQYYHEGDRSHWHTDQNHVFFTRSEAESYVKEQGAIPDLTFGDYIGHFHFAISDCTLEHRENYSMGEGNYLKDGHSDSSGWRVCSRDLPLSSDTLGDERFEICREACAPPAPLPEGASPMSHWDGDVNVSRNIEKDGIEIRFKAKPSADTLTRIKGMGYRWSRYSSCWYCKFTASRMAEALRFAESLKGIVTANDESLSA